jgi:hypothetical protein
MLCILSPLRNVEQYCARRLSRSPPHYSIAQATCDVAKEMHFGAERINVGRTTHIREAA